MTLQALLAPRSVAIIGASNDPARIGGRTLKLLLGYGFPGPVYAVNPMRAEVQGQVSYPSVADIPGDVDCAVITVPAALVAEAVRHCIQKRVRAAVIFSGGFAESGDAAGQAALVTEARGGGMRLLGPNCVGLYNVMSRTALSFLTTIPRTSEPGRSIGVVTQSGGYGAHILGLAQARGLSVGQWVTTGNECDVEFGEVLEAFAGDDAVDVIVGYIEGVRSRETLVRGLTLARARHKPVILMKTGHTAAGAAAAASHTASLAGVDTAYDAVFRKFGVHRARSTEEVLDVAYAVTRLRGFAPGPIGVLTNSGGMGVQFADFVCDAGLTLASIPEAAQQRILALVPNGSGRNPIDITAQWINDPPLIRACVDAAFDGVAFSAFILFFGSGESPIIRQAMTGIVDAYPACRFVMCFLHEPGSVAFFEALGCLVFEEPARATRALAAMMRFGHLFAGPPAREADAGADYPVLEAGQRFDERQAKRLLARIGVASPMEELARDGAEAAAIAARIGGACVVKIVSPDIAHKTEVGGVMLGLADPAAVATAADTMLRRVGAAVPGARLEGVLVSPMLEAGVECIVGAHCDPALGPMLMVGMGGVGVELLKDVAWRMAPVDAAEALSMLRALKLGPLLFGHRGSAPLDVEALVRVIVAISGLAAANAAVLDSIEVNPILVMPQGALALDALITTKKART